MLLSAIVNILKRLIAFHITFKNIKIRSFKNFLYLGNENEGIKIFTSYKNV
jgi:hypothetical protein